MEQSTTVEMDHTNFDELKNQIIGRKDENVNKNVSLNNDEKTEKEERQIPQSKRYTFRKGEQAIDVDDDAEIEFVADKRNMKLTLRELKDRAAGDIAVKNRMHALAEEKKRVQSTLKQFADMSKNDPLAALEYISKKANETDSEFEYNKYLEKLADQAEKLGQMDEKERKALELEKKLTKAEQDLSLKEREALAIRRKQEILSDYPEIGDSQFSQMVETVLNDEDLLDGMENENDVLNKVEELIQETLTQRDIIKVIDEINPAYRNDTNLIFSLSDQLRQNPDLDEEDIRDIIRDVIKPEERRSAPQSSERQMASRTLSSKQRQSAPMEHIRAQGGTDFDVLKMKLLEEKETFKRTPLYMR